MGTRIIGHGTDARYRSPDRVSEPATGGSGTAVIVAADYADYADFLEVYALNFKQTDLLRSNTARVVGTASTECISLVRKCLAVSTHPMGQCSLRRGGGLCLV